MGASDSLAGGRKPDRLAELPDDDFTMASSSCDWLTGLRKQPSKCGCGARSAPDQVEDNSKT